MAAGLAQLNALEDGEVYSHISHMGDRLAEGLRELASNMGIAACVNSIQSLACMFFGIAQANSYEDVKKSDTSLYARFFNEMLKQGVYLAPSQYEAMFISGAHSEKDIGLTLEKAGRALANIRKEGLA
jgi:glutamate-1-semialdehyde 2,1-aminomutase